MPAVKENMDELCASKMFQQVRPSSVVVAVQVVAVQGKLEMFMLRLVGIWLGRVAGDFEEGAEWAEQWAEQGWVDAFWNLRYGASGPCS